MKMDDSLDSGVEISVPVQEMFDLAGLTEREQSCLIWRFWMGCTLREVGDRDWGINRETARRRVYSALYKLKRLHDTGKIEMRDWLYAGDE